MIFHKSLYSQDDHDFLLKKQNKNRIKLTFYGVAFGLRKSYHVLDYKKVAES